MTTLSLSKGQPIDYAFMTSLIESISELQKQSTTISRISESAGSNAHASTPTKNLVFYTGYVEIVNTSSANDWGTGSVTYSFDAPGFKGTPIINVTAVQTAPGSKPEEVILGINSISSTSFTIKATFTKKDNPSIGVNIIAIGQPVSV